jgi:hypothetical protein
MHDATLAGKQSQLDERCRFLRCLRLQFNPLFTALLAA